MREAGRLVRRAHELVREMVRPGVTTRQIDTEVEKLFTRHNAIPLFKNYPGEVLFPTVTCMSVNNAVVHGIPNNKPLKEGDILSVDTGCNLGGWCGDSAWTYAVGEVSPLRKKLLEVTEESLWVAIEALGRRQWWSEVADEITRCVHAAGFSLVSDFVGHGIGREMHEDPQVPNIVDDDFRARHDFRIKPGLVLAVEPMVNTGVQDCRVLGDKWTQVTADGSDSAHFEHTVAITNSGVQVLTGPDE